MELYQYCLELITKVADAHLVEFNNDGYALPGHNGSYRNDDTPVRNTAHWLVTLCILKRITQASKYNNAIIKFKEYLMRESNYGSSGAICCMKDDKFDHINGLIGQAWVIEGLLYAYSDGRDKAYLNRAISIFRVQRYNWKKHAWDRIELDGTNIGHDKVYNHQLWFAAAGAKILEYKDIPDIRAVIDDFLIRSKINNFMVYPNGMISHNIGCSDNFFETMKIKVKKLYRQFTGKELKNKGFDQRNYELSYHLFNMYGFALIYPQFSSHEFFSSVKFKRILKFTHNSDNFAQLKKNPRFSYGYNSPAFEYPFVSQVFFNNIDNQSIKDMLDFQINYCLNKSAYKFEFNTEDPETLTARIYELARWIEMLCFKEE